MKKIKVIAGIILLNLLSFLPQPGAEVANQVLAVVGDEVITILDVEKLIAPQVEEIKARGGGLKAEQQIASLRQQALDKLIQDRLLAGEANRLGIKVTKEDVDGGLKRILEINNIDMEELIKTLAKDGYTLEEYRKELEGQILRARLVYTQVKAKIIIPEEEKRAIYEARQSEFATVSEIELRRILLPADASDLAQEIIAKLDSGADFAELVREHSKGPEAADGGSLGFFKLEQLSAVIREAVANLKSGEHSRPVQTGEGLQIFQVAETKTKQGKPYEEVEPLLTEELLQKEIDKRFNELMEKARKRVFIRIMKAEN